MRDLACPRGLAFHLSPLLPLFWREVRSLAHLAPGPFLVFAVHYPCHKLAFAKMEANQEFFPQQGFLYFV